MRQFGDEGGSIVTEWDGASLLGSSYDATYRYAAGAVPGFGWINSAVGAGDILASNTAITQTVPADPIFAGIANPLRGAGGTEFFFVVRDGIRNIANTYMQPLATFPGNGDARVPQRRPARHRARPSLRRQPDHRDLRLPGRPGPTRTSPA